MISLFSLPWAWHFERLHRQDNAISIVEANGGIIGYSNEWIVPSTGKKVILPGDSPRPYLIDRDVVTIQIPYDCASEDVQIAIDALPTIKTIMIKGDCPTTELKKLELRFPWAHVIDARSLNAITANLEPEI